MISTSQSEVAAQEVGLHKLDVAYNNEPIDGSPFEFYVSPATTGDVYAYGWAKSVETSKLGGWPATIQSEPWWDYRTTPHDFEYVLQIGPEPKSGWGADSLFLARAKDDPTKWAIDVQMY